MWVLLLTAICPLAYMFLVFISKLFIPQFNFAFILGIFVFLSIFAIFMPRLSVFSFAFIIFWIGLSAFLSACAMPMPML